MCTSSSAYQYMLLNRAKVGFIALLYNLNVRDYRFMSLGCFVTPKWSFTKALTWRQLRRECNINNCLKEPEVWQCLLIHSINKGKAEGTGNSRNCDRGLACYKIWLILLLGQRKNFITAWIETKSEVKDRSFYWNYISCIIATQTVSTWFVPFQLKLM